MARRLKNPTKAEAKKMMSDLIDLGYKYAKVKSLRGLHTGEHLASVLDEELKEHARFVLDEIGPTFLVMKLGCVVEDAVNILWAKRFPEIPAKKIHHEDKLKVMRELHALDVSAFTALWTLRSQCAHGFTRNASWADIDKHFSAVYAFIAKFAGERQTYRYTVKRFALKLR